LVQDEISVTIKKNQGRNKYIFKFNFYVWDGTRMQPIMYQWPFSAETSNLISLTKNSPNTNFTYILNCVHPHIYKHILNIYFTKLRLCCSARYIMHPQQKKFYDTGITASLDKLRPTERLYTLYLSQSNSSSPLIYHT